MFTSSGRPIVQQFSPKIDFFSDSEILEFQNQNPARELSLYFDFLKMEGVLIHSNQQFLSNVMDQQLIYRVPIRSNKEILKKKHNSSLQLLL